MEDCSLPSLCNAEVTAASIRPPKWIKPQLTRLVDEAPAGDGWLHEIKYDGYRMHARIDGRDIKLLTRTGLDWSHRYRRTIEALGSLKVKSAYLDGALCALNADGVTRSSSTSEVLLHSHLASAGAAIACSVAVINRRTPSAPTFEEAPGGGDH